MLRGVVLRVHHMDLVHLHLCGSSPRVGGRSLAEDEIALELEYVLLISLCICVFWWPCVKLVPVLWKYIKEFLWLIYDLWKSLWEKPPPPPPLPPGKQRHKPVNKKGHISNKPPTLFFEDD